MMSRIGIIGVGLLGSAVATRLLQHGYEVIGYDTRATQLEALHSHGLRAAATVAEAAAETEAVFTILPTLDSVEAVVCGPGGLLETASHPTVLIQMSTISPELTCRLHTVAAAAGLAFLDAPISGTSAMVARGDCTILVGGDPALVQRCRPIFDAIAQQTVHMGTVGMAALAKLVTNLLVALNTAALAEALVLGAKGGRRTPTLGGQLSHARCQGSADGCRRLPTPDETRALSQRPPADAGGRTAVERPVAAHQYSPAALRGHS
jgi:3-hydroxyisobutyrate dehydrogenase-like beta-hydroxyacid dehydrogenase